jgi:hypothetical protein
MDIAQWVTNRGGIVHRSDLLDRGVSAAAIRAAVTAGRVRRVRRYWVATDAAPAELVVAAQVTGVISCVSAARHRGWWMPDDVAAGIHVRVASHARPPVDVVAHWDRPIVATDPRVLVESIEDAHDLPWVMEPAGAASRHWALQRCRLAGLEPDVRYETADLQAQIRLIESGNAVALMPELVWAGRETSCRLIELAGDARRSIFTSVRDSGAHHPATLALREVLEEVANARRLPSTSSGS